MSTPDGRYEVGTNEFGLYEHCTSFNEASLVARKLWERNAGEFAVYVFDRMAHFGAVQEWKIVDGVTFQKVTIRR